VVPVEFLSDAEAAARAGQAALSALDAIEEPPSLIELRQLMRAMLPRVSVPEVILEVMAWEPRFVEAFNAVSGGRSRLKDLEVTIAACLTAHALNIGFDPIVKEGVPALERGRVSHVDQNYMRAETYTAANPRLVERQAGIPLARRPRVPPRAGRHARPTLVAH
jgi:hypothetical protein